MRTPMEGFDLSAEHIIDGQMNNGRSGQCEPNLRTCVEGIRIVLFQRKRKRRSAAFIENARMDEPLVNSR